MGSDGKVTCRRWLRVCSSDAPYTVRAARCAMAVSAFSPRQPLDNSNSLILSWFIACRHSHSAPALRASVCLTVRVRSRPRHSASAFLLASSSPSIAPVFCSSDQYLSVCSRTARCCSGCRRPQTSGPDPRGRCAMSGTVPPRPLPLVSALAQNPPSAACPCGHVPSWVCLYKNTC